SRLGARKAPKPVCRSGGPMRTSEWGGPVPAAVGRADFRGSCPSSSYNRPALIPQGENSMRLPRRLPLITLSVLLTAGLAGAQPPDRPKEWSPDLMMKVKQVGGVTVSPDGKRVAFTVRQAVMTDDKSEYLTHLHVADIDGNHSRQLTQGDKSCDNPQWSPDGSSIGFLSGRSGKKQIWVIRTDGGEAERVTDVKGE